MKKISIEEQKNYITVLEKSFLFTDAAEVISEFVINDKRFQWESYQKGEIIYDYDNYRNSLALILKGRVSVMKNSRGRVLINTLRDGEAFGGSVLFGRNEKFIATVRAESDCVLLFISKELMEEIIKMSPQANMNFIGHLSESLIFLNKRLDIFTAGGAEARTAEYLMKNCHRDSDGRLIADGMSMTALAEYLDVGRASLYRILSDFEKRGIIRHEGRKIYIIKDIKKEI